MTLKEFFKGRPRMALAFSGGVDSAYLLCVAARSGADVRPYYVQSAFQPRFELDDARRLASRLGVSLTVIPVDILACPDVTVNSPERCYRCKQFLFRSVMERAAEDGCHMLMDGTNASDKAGDRPGMRALAELGVRSPLRECGLTKADIRRLSKEAGLFTWDKPAYACLATRIPTGTPITARDLERTETAEDYLRSLGLADFRVRLLGDTAKLQLPAAQLSRVLEHREEIVSNLKKQYSAVLLDLEERNEQ